MIGKINNKKLTIKNIIFITLYAVLFWFLIGYIILPTLNTFAQAFYSDNKLSLDVITNYLSNENNLKVIMNTFILGIGSVLVCGIMGISLALYMTFICGKFKKIIHIILLSPMMIPGVIMVIACIQLYGESGIVTKGIEFLLPFIKEPYQFSGLKGILFVIAYTQYVYFYLNVYIALKYIDYSTVEAARGMGASKIRVFFDVIWPVITPAVITSTIVTFASGISSFSAPNLIGGFKVLSTQIS